MVESTIQDLISLRDPQLLERLEALQMGRGEDEPLRTNRRLLEIVDTLDLKLTDLLLELDSLKKELSALEKRNRRLRRRYAESRGRRWLRSLRSVPQVTPAIAVEPASQPPIEALLRLERMELEREQLQAKLQQLQEQIATHEAAGREQEAARREQEAWRREQEQAIARASLHDQELQDLRRQLHEREQQMRAAQLHLAKKVKENALLRDQLDQQKMETLEVQQRLAQQEMAGQQVSIHFEREQAIHQERLRAAEERALKCDLQAQEWQEKLSTAQERWQEERRRIQELERIEAEYQQMVSVFSHLRSFVATPSLISQAATVVSSRAAERCDSDELPDLFQLADTGAVDN